MKTLVTLGCSWTFGIGVGYDETTMCNSQDIISIKQFPDNFTEQEYNFIKGSSQNFIKVLISTKSRHLTKKKSQSKLHLKLKFNSAKPHL